MCAQDARDDLAAAQAEAAAAAARAQETAEASSRATAGDGVAPELAERLAQEEAAASGALAEAQEQVWFYIPVSAQKSCTSEHNCCTHVLHHSNRIQYVASCLCSFILNKDCEFIDEHCAHVLLLG